MGANATLALVLKCAAADRHEVGAGHAQGAGKFQTHSQRVSGETAAIAALTIASAERHDSSAPLPPKL